MTYTPASAHPYDDGLGGEAFLLPAYRSRYGWWPFIDELTRDTKRYCWAQRDEDTGHRQFGTVDEARAYAMRERE